MAFPTFFGFFPFDCIKWCINLRAFDASHNLIIFFQKTFTSWAGSQRSFWLVMWKTKWFSLEISVWKSCDKLVKIVLFTEFEFSHEWYFLLDDEMNHCYQHDTLYIFELELVLPLKLFSNKIFICMKLCEKSGWLKSFWKKIYPLWPR